MTYTAIGHVGDGGIVTDQNLYDLELMNVGEIMKIGIIALSFLMLMSGCALHNINNDMKDNAFLDQSPIENDLSGTYTGPLGPYLSTYVIAKNGTGVMCHFHNGNAILLKIKIYSKTDSTYNLITETGLKSVLSKSRSGSISIESYGQKYTLKPDQNLTMSNFSCKEKLSI